MTKDEIQFWMLIAFAVASIIGFYKVYFLFNTPIEGIDTKTQHNQLEDIIIDYLKQLNDVNLTANKLFELLMELEVLQTDEYKNFNQNRLNQLLQRLFYTYEAQDIPELILHIKNDS